jgi:hypothetical protein
VEDTSCAGYNMSRRCSVGYLRRAGYDMSRRCVVSNNMSHRCGEG